VTRLLAIAERHLEAYNTRDFDTWDTLLDDDVELVADGGRMRGRAAVRAFAAATMRAFPGLRAELIRVAAESEDTIVIEYRPVNPDPARHQWRLDGIVCEIYEVRAGRIASIHSYCLAGAGDSTATALRSLLEEQRALRRVATLAAGGASLCEILQEVAVQASRALGRESATLVRYDGDGHAVVVADHGNRVPLGMRVPADDDSMAAELARSLGMRACVGAPIRVGGCRWGLICVTSFDGPLPPGTEDRLAQFAELVGTAIANAESRAELRASRARVVAATDESRRRIQRDLHDGAQQRLVHTIINLKVARSAVRDDDPLAEILGEALRNAESATAELRELVHGIVPHALGHGGLHTGVRSLIGEMELPVRVDIAPGRLPAPVERTAYFVVAEALTNAVKHAGATSAHVSAVVEGDVLALEISDDGIGGADPGRGTGLLGLSDRVAASGGTVALMSPPGRGTTLAVRLPAGTDHRRNGRFERRRASDRAPIAIER